VLFRSGPKAVGVRGLLINRSENMNFFEKMSDASSFDITLFEDKKNGVVCKI